MYSLLNDTVYGHHAVDTVLDELKQYMYTPEKKQKMDSTHSPQNPEKHSPEDFSTDPFQSLLTSHSDSKNDSQHETQNIPMVAKPAPATRGPPPRWPVEQSLFWSIFIAVKGYGEYLREQRRAANVWIEERLKIVDQLKQAPRKMKESNHKLTLESIQALFSSALTSRQDKEEDAILYSAFYNVPIVILYDKTAVVFDHSGTETTSTIYLQARATEKIRGGHGPQGQRRIIDYSLVDATVVDVNMENRFIVDNLGSGLKGISTYKTDVLRELYLKFVAKDNDDAKKTKPEMYEEMRKFVAIDRCFI